MGVRKEKIPEIRELKGNHTLSRSLMHCCLAKRTLSHVNEQRARGNLLPDASFPMFVGMLIVRLSPFAIVCDWMARERNENSVNLSEKQVGTVMVQLNISKVRKSWSSFGTRECNMVLIDGFCFSSPINQRQEISFVDLRISWCSLTIGERADLVRMYFCWTIPSRQTK